MSLPDHADGGEEMGHEVKRGDAVARVVEPAVEYQYSANDIKILTKALDAANYAIYYLGKKDFGHHSDVIALLQALQDISNCLCVQLSHFEISDHYYCYNNDLPFIDHIVVAGNEIQVVGRL